MGDLNAKKSETIQVLEENIYTFLFIYDAVKDFITVTKNAVKTRQPIALHKGK